MIQKHTTLAVIGLLLSCSLQAAELPRGPSGYPDLSGVWFFGTATPFERPTELGNQKVYSAEEANTILTHLSGIDEKRMQPSDPDRPPPEVVAMVGQEADDNFVLSRTNLTKIDGEYRTSLIIDPANGRLPFKDKNRDIFELWWADGIGEFDGPEVRPASERCLNVTGPIAPMVSWYFNANLRILQTNENILIQGEMLKPRILNYSNPTPLASQGWSGQSLMFWTDDVLVVKTNKFRPELSWFRLKSSDQLQVTEYFEMVSQDEILYRYVLEDSVIYSAPHTVEMILQRRSSDTRMYEFACHEHNHSLGAILRGARLAESSNERLAD